MRRPEEEFEIYIVLFCFDQKDGWGITDSVDQAYAKTLKIRNLITYIQGLEIQHIENSSQNIKLQPEISRNQDSTGYVLINSTLT